MSGYTNQEPVDKYIEKVRVGRRFVQEHDVILSYINPGVGRGGEYNLFYEIWSVSRITLTCL